MSAEDALEQLLEKIDQGTAFIGLGNRDRGDDAFGLRFIDDLKHLIPERFLSEEDGLESVVLRLMNDDKITNIVFIDSCDFGGTPGSYSLLRLDSIDETISTHKIPVSMLMALLQNANKDTFVFGVQPKSLEFQEDISNEIKNVLEKLEIAVRLKLE